MVQSLRKRPRPDDLVTDQRRMTNRSGRMIYLGLLAVLAVFMLNFLLGDFLFLRADGIVVRDRHSVEATYLSRIVAVNVREGQAVRSGDPLFKVQSIQMLERLADLSARDAELAAKLTEFRIRAETVAKLLPLATRREAETKKVLARFDDLSDVKLVTSARYDEALRTHFEARQSLVELQAQKHALSQELAALDIARADALNALKDLRIHYGEGILRAPVDGDVGVSVPSTGDVHQPGEAILGIYSGEPYLLAYLPRRYLFPISQGMKVRVASGREKATGTVSKILPVTDALPKEFQNAFRPQDRSQLARIVLDQSAPFPLHEKVRVTTGMFGF